MALAITHLPCYIIQQKYAKENLSTFLCLNIKQLFVEIKELDAQVQYKTGQTTRTDKFETVKG